MLTSRPKQTSSCTLRSSKALFRAWWDSSSVKPRVRFITQLYALSNFCKREKTISIFLLQMYKAFGFLENKIHYHSQTKWVLTVREDVHIYFNMFSCYMQTRPLCLSKKSVFPCICQISIQREKSTRKTKSSSIFLDGKLLIKFLHIHKFTGKIKISDLTFFNCIWNYQWITNDLYWHLAYKTRTPILYTSKSVQMLVYKFVRLNVKKKYYVCMI